MIGRRCKARERLSRAPLIGRALRDTFQVPSAPTVLKKRLPRALCGPQGALRAPPRLTQPAPQRPPGAGGHGGRGTPGPIPNPEVKPASADGTAGATLWETRAPPAPGARCAGSGRGGANMSTWKEGPFGVPFLFMSAMCAPIPHISIHVHFSSLTYDAWYRERGVTVDSAEGFAVSPPY